MKNIFNIRRLNNEFKFNFNFILCQSYHLKCSEEINVNKNILITLL